MIDTIHLRGRKHTTTNPSTNMVIITCPGIFRKCVDIVTYDDGSKEVYTYQNEIRDMSYCVDDKVTEFIDPETGDDGISFTKVDCE